MLCNKDEATMAKAIAESKIEEKDYIGAKMFAQKAQNLYPGLDGISQMLILLEVYLRAENKITGETDWYRVLDVHPLADEDTIKKQYKKLSLMLHPDKNRSFGAGDAFHLISHAYRLLQDKLLKDKQLRVPTHNGGPSTSCSGGRSVPPRPGKEKVPSAHAGGSSAAPQPTPKSRNRRAKVPLTPDPPTFWTICSSCRIYFEYNRKYCRRSLRCLECNTPFLATDIGRPKLSGSGSGPVPWRRRSPSANFPSQGNVAADNSSMKSNNIEEVGSAVPLEHVHLKRSSAEAHGSGGWEGSTKMGKLV